MKAFMGKTVCLVSMLSVVGCAINNANPKDPFESGNRKIYAFNYALDRVIVRPVAKVYDFVMPNIAQKGVLNVFANVGEVPNVVNDLLQAEPAWTLVDTWRFVINTTVGVCGLFDVASKMGLPKHKQDFGLTLAKWSGSVDGGPYIMLPFFGPSNVRDTVGLPFNFVFNPISYIHPTWKYAVVKGTDVVSTRANLLMADKVIDEAFDPYIFVRNAYFQNRENLINRNSGKKEESYSRDTYVDEQPAGNSKIPTKNK